MGDREIFAIKIKEKILSVSNFSNIDCIDSILTCCIVNSLLNNWKVSLNKKKLILMFVICLENEDLYLHQSYLEFDSQSMDLSKILD